MAQPTIQQIFDLALQHHQAGRLAEARRLYRQILDHEPRHAEALHLLGVICGQSGELAAAVDFIDRAIAINPQVARYYLNLGVFLKAQQRTDEAIAAYRKVIAIDPNLAEAYNNLGNALRDKKQLEEAVACFERAIALKPDDAQAHSNLGNALRDKGQFEESIAACRRAIALRPNYAEAYNNLGNALRDKGQLEEAIAAYRQAIALQPNDAQAHSNLGNALRDKGQLEEAIAACRRAIALRPDLSDAHNNLGNALNDKGQLDEAVAAFRQALVLRPNYAQVHSNLGNTLTDKGLLDEAIAAHRQAIALKPDYADAYNNLGNALRDSGQLDDAIAAYHQAIALSPNDAKIHSNLILALNYHPDYHAAAILHQARQFEAQQARGLTQAAAGHDNTPDPQRRLRVGYLGPDFRLHPVGRFLLPLLAHHHHESFEITAYPSVHCDDAITQRLRSYVDVWHSIVDRSDAQAADQIRSDRIDILVDLTLHTGRNRLLLFCRKPAPVQVTWLGYPGTTGLSAMDWRLSDPYLDPPGKGDEFYVERTLRLPHCFWCYPPPEASPAVNDLPAAPTGSVTFGCFNNFGKVTVPTLDLWATLLGQVKGSNLVIHAHAGSHQETVRQRFASAGVEGSRIRFVAFQGMETYFAQYGRIDLALDPFPFGGGTTTCDALWMGVPVVSLAGRTAVGRAGVSLLSNVGLPELIAQTPEQYLSIARELAADLPRLAQLRRQLRPMMQASVLMDAPRFAGQMEAAYRQMWVHWCARQTEGREAGTTTL